MKHYIIVKFVDGFDYLNRLDEIEEIFGRTLEIDGINTVDIKLSNSDRENRYDLMIKIELEKSSLKKYDTSAPHNEWKSTFGAYIKSKAIFDCD